MDNRRNNYSWLNKKPLILSLLMFFMLIALTISSKAQKGLIPEKYLRIIPGVSTRADVEKLFPKSDPKSHSVDYDRPNLLIGIEYSLGSCESKLGWGKLPEWTVERVSYDWPEEKKVRLSEIVLDPKRFDKRQLGDVTVHDSYVNDEWGISVVYDRKWKRVLGIDIKPSAKLQEKYTCWKDEK